MTLPDSDEREVCECGSPALVMLDGLRRIAFENVPVCGRWPECMRPPLVNACQTDLRTDKDRECFDNIVQAAMRVLCGSVNVSVPLSLAQRILAALDMPSVLGNRERIALAAELRGVMEHKP